MRHPRIIIVSIGLAAIAAVGGSPPRPATGSPASGTTPAASAPAAVPARRRP
jgi:hypothetical protein